MEKITIVQDQLKRMRQMNRYYHHQFLIDVRLLLAISVLLLIVENSIKYYLIPFVSLFGAVLLAFHAHYLIFSRNFSDYLEKQINTIAGEELLIAHKLENNYFFPVQDKKIVVAALGKSFTWFGFVTLFITTYGIGFFIYGFMNIDYSQSTTYTLVLLISSLITLLVGYWWFVYGEGEKRLRRIYEQ